MAGTVNITIEGNYTIIDIAVATPKYATQKKSIPNEEILIKALDTENQLLINADGVNYKFENAEVVTPAGANARAKMDSLLASLDAGGGGADSSADYKTKIQAGLITGERIWESSGERADAGTTAQGEDIWRGNELSTSGGTSIPIPNASGGDLVSVTFESVNDTLAGTGIQKLEIHILDTDGNESSILVDANGGTVDTGVLARYVQEAHAIQVGSNGVADGMIAIHKTGDNTATGIYNMIALGGNQSLTINKMVPKGKTFFMKGWQSAEARGKRVTARIRSTDREGIIDVGIFLFKGVQYLNKNTSGEKPMYSVHPEFSIVKVSVWSDQADGELSTNFWGILKDN